MQQGPTLPVSLKNLVAKFPDSQFSSNVCSGITIIVICMDLSSLDYLTVVLNCVFAIACLS